MPKIENDCLSLEANLLGGEITSLFDKRSQKPLFYDESGTWKCTDHILFPFIGPDSSYVIDGKTYHCSTQHGFLRNNQMTLLKDGRAEMILTLSDNAATRAIYPFSFMLTATYHLEKDSLIRSYRITNKGKEPLPFAIGDHPAYRVAFGKATISLGTNLRYLPRPNFVLQDSMPFPQEGDYCLSKKDFAQYETIVLENPKHPLTLDTGLGEIISFDFTSPYLAIWSPVSDLDSFVCVEPWWGLPQYQGMPEEVKERKAINLIKREKVFSSKITFKCKN